MPSPPQSLKVLDSRSGKKLEVPIQEGVIPAKAFAEVGLRVYDPGYQNTAVVRSSVCYIDGDRGILEYRGYPIEELAEHATFLEVAYLLIYGELPTEEQAAEWTSKVMRHTFVHSRLTEMMQTFNYDAHPMGMFISTMAAMSTFHANANPALQGADLYLGNVELMNKQIVRILGKAPTVAAAAYRHRIGRPYNLPQNHLGYAENLLYMMDRLAESDYRAHPVLCRALEIMFILHADHEMNCSTAAMRHIGSSRADPYSAIAGAAAALYGPLHGGANEAVLRMLEEDVKSVEGVAGFLEQVKAKKKKLMGFGHRVYRNYDPRAKIIRRVAYDVNGGCSR